MAYYDALTDLPNRAFCWNVSTKCSGVRGTEKPEVPCFSFDVDDFRIVN
jgi:GGDEF domain-containing protein